jgi:hypothetical protein
MSYLHILHIHTKSPQQLVLEETGNINVNITNGVERKLGPQNTQAPLISFWKSRKYLREFGVKSCFTPVRSVRLAKEEEGLISHKAFHSRVCLWPWDKLKAAASYRHFLIYLRVQ